MTKPTPSQGSSGRSPEGQRSIGREEAERQQRVEEAAALLTQTVDSLQRRPPDQMALAAREALENLKPLLEMAIEALEDIEWRRDLTDEELSRRYAFKVLLATAR